MTSTDDAKERARARRRDLQRRARAKARAEGINYTTALRQLLAEQSAAASTDAPQRQIDEPDDPNSEPEWPEDVYEWPTTAQLIDRHLDGPMLEDIGLLHPGAPDRTFPSEVFMDLDLPEQANDAEIIEMHVDTSTRELHPVEEFEGGTEIVHVQAEAEVAIRALVRNEDLPALSAHSVLYPDVDDGWTQVRFDRQVIVEFDATVDVGAESAELEYAGATQLRP